MGQISPGSQYGMENPRFDWQTLYNESLKDLKGQQGYLRSLSKET